MRHDIDMLLGVLLIWAAVSSLIYVGLRITEVYATRYAKRQVWVDLLKGGTTRPPDPGQTTSNTTTRRSTTANRPIP